MRRNCSKKLGMYQTLIKNFFFLKTQNKGSMEEVPYFVLTSMGTFLNDKYFINFMHKCLTMAIFVVMQCISQRGGFVG